MASCFYISQYQVHIVPDSKFDQKTPKTNSTNIYCLLIMCHCCAYSTYNSFYPHDTSEMLVLHTHFIGEETELSIFQSFPLFPPSTFSSICQVVILFQIDHFSCRVSRKKHGEVAAEAGGANYKFQESYM